MPLAWPPPGAIGGFPPLAGDGLARVGVLWPCRRPLAILMGGPLPGLNLSRVLAAVAILHHRGERRGVDGVYGQRQERLVRRVRASHIAAERPPPTPTSNILPPKRLVHLPVRLERLEERVQLVVGPSRTERGGLRRSSLASLLFLRFGRRRSSDTGSNARAVVGGRDEFLSHARQPENSQGGQRRGSAGRSPPTCRARTLKVHRREPPGTARVCCGPLRRARLPPPSRPQRFNHRIRTTTALWCVRNPRRFFSPACGIPPPRRCAGGFPQTTGAAEIDSGAESQAFASGSPCSDPRRPRWL